MKLLRNHPSYFSSFISTSFGSNLKALVGRRNYKVHIKEVQRHCTEAGHGIHKVVSHGLVEPDLITHSRDIIHHTRAGLTVNYSHCGVLHSGAKLGFDLKVSLRL